MANPSSDYTFNPFMKNRPLQVGGPNQSWEEQLTTQALMEALAGTPDQIRAIRPPLPINPFPSRFGYRQEALGIMDVVDINDIYPERRNFSGKQSGYEGTSYPSLNVW